jgi:hypothetical protein
MSVKVHEAFSIDSAQDRFLWFDDFLGDQLQDEWTLTVVATGAGTVVDAQTGGIYRLSAATNATNDAARIDWGGGAPIRCLLATKKVTLEVRAKLSSAANVETQLALFFDGTNFMRFRFDTGVGVNWLVETDDGTGPTSADSGIAADTDYHVYRIECFPTGEVHYYIDGVETGNSPIITDITANYLMPYLYVETLAVAVKQLDIDYVVARQER